MAPLPNVDALAERVGEEREAEVRFCHESRGGCGRSFPLIDEYWHRDRDGLRTDLCKFCRARKERERREAQVRDEIKKVDNLLGGILSRSAESGGSDLPHAREVVELIMRNMGGPQGFANFLVANMLAAPAGSPVRQKHIGDVLKLIDKLSERGDVESPIDKMSDRELMQRVRQIGQEYDRRREADQFRNAAKQIGSSPQQIAQHGPSGA